MTLTKDDQQAREARQRVERALAGGSKLLPEGISRLSQIFCGCGDHDSAWQWVLDHLRLKASSETNFFHPGSAAELIATYVVDHCDLTEHGTSIAGGWLTDDGKATLAFLEENGVDWKDKGDWIDSDGISWGSFP